MPTTTTPAAEHPTLPTARPAASGALIIPNSFQLPNVYTDHVMAYLTGEEWKALTYAIRNILGWQNSIASRRGHISLRQFRGGKTGSDGRVIDCGTGLSLSALQRALTELERFGLLRALGDSDDGREYYLEEDGEKINWEALHARHAANLLTARKRTEAARQAPRQPNDDQSAEGVLSDRTPYMAVENGGGVLSDRTGVSCRTEQGCPVGQDNQTQNKPNQTQQRAIARVAEILGVNPDEGKPDPLAVSLRLAQSASPEQQAIAKVREHVRESLWPLAEMWVRETNGMLPSVRGGKKAEQGVWSYWESAWVDMAKASVTPDIEREAIRAHVKDGLTLKSPESILSRARSIQLAAANKKTSKDQPVNITNQRLAKKDTQR